MMMLSVMLLIMHGGMTETMRTMMITSTIDRWGGMIEHMRMIIRRFFFAHALGHAIKLLFSAYSRACRGMQRHVGDMQHMLHSGVPHQSSAVSMAEPSSNAPLIVTALRISFRRVLYGIALRSIDATSSSSSMLDRGGSGSCSKRRT